MDMTNRMKYELDKHITGNWGEDQFKDEQLDPEEAPYCDYCGQHPCRCEDPTYWDAMAEAHGE